MVDNVSNRLLTSLRLVLAKTVTYQEMTLDDFRKAVAPHAGEGFANGLAAMYDAIVRNGCKQRRPFLASLLLTARNRLQWRRFEEKQQAVGFPTSDAAAVPAGKQGEAREGFGLNQGGSGQQEV